MEVIEDKDVKSFAKVTKLIMCSGKIYYELNAARKEKNAEHVSIIRVEQLYPFPQKQIDELLKNYNDNVEIVWVQEEPLNMGGAMFVKYQLNNCNLQIISRPPSGVTSEGLTALHKVNQALIIDEAMK